MTFQVHAGARPGRPRLLLYITAGLLAGMLGLAALQVQRRDLRGDEQRIADTPLFVRPPRGWQLDPQRPNRFVLPADTRGRGPALVRHIEFHYERRPAFFSPLELVQATDILQGARVTEARPSMIGRWPALELHTRADYRYRNVTFPRDELIRLTCLPRGQVVRVSYQPLLELRPADIALMDEVCESLRIDDPTLTGRPDEFLSNAGLKFPREADWHVIGPDFAEVPAVFVGGAIDRVPAWAIGIYRTCLAANRTPRDLLLDFAGERWRLPPSSIAELIEEEKRADGAAVASVRLPGAMPGGEVAAAWVVAHAPTEAAILFVWHASNPQATAQALGAAAHIAGELQITAIPSIPSVETAMAAGAQLAADLRQGGRPRWGRERVQSRYRAAGRNDVIYTTRTAVDRDPAKGHSGQVTRERPEQTVYRLTWNVDGQGATYDWASDALLPDRRELRIRERRADPDGTVTRQAALEGDRPRNWALKPGPSFVPRPLLSVVQAWVARGEPPVALITTTADFSPGLHAELLRQLPPDGPYPRVLVQADYSPEGVIIAFDDARGEEEYWQTPTNTYRRVP
ncbi:MAG: hypothetical protein AB1716_02790 [Planctomycetota bacterium]